MEKIIAEGHRGYCSEYPENTLISFEAAMDIGADMFEFDIWLSKDKIPVLIHDGNCLRTCGVDRHVRDMTLAEIKELDASYPRKFGDKFAGANIKIPTLEEMAQLVCSKNPDFILGVEIKGYTDETVDNSVEVLKEYGLFDRACFYAFDAPTIKRLKTLHGARTMGYPDFQMKRFDYVDGYRYYDEIGINLAIAKSEIYDIYLAKNLPIHIYCADNEADVAFCIEKGATVITANDLVPLLKILGRK